MVCDLSEPCFAASMGMPKSEYEKKFEALENPRVRFTGGMRK